MIRILIYNIASYAINALPPEYRQTKFILFAQSLLFGVLWNWNWFGYYRQTTPLPAWNTGITYAANAPVIYNFTIYISLKAGNIGNNPGTSPTYWYKIAGNFLGVTERIKYNGFYLTLTYALNRYFGTTFRQPPYPAPYGGSGTFSDIFITNLAPVYVSFGVESVGYTLGSVTSIATSYGVTSTTITGLASSYQFLIHIPSAVFIALGATTAIRTAVVNRFVSGLVPAGIGWQITTY